MVGVKRVTKFTLGFLICIAGVLSAIAQTNNSDAITLPVSILSSNGNIVADLPPEKFSILIDKSPQSFSEFTNGDHPASIVILIDLSNSVRDRLMNRVELIKRNLFTFVQAAHPANEYAIYTFSRSSQIAVDWTPNSASLVAKIEQLDLNKFAGATSLFDACVDAMQSLKNRSNQKRIVLVISDNADTNSKYKDSDVKKLSYELLAPLYFINVGALKVSSVRQAAGGTLDILAEKLAEDLAAASGGISILPTTQDALDNSFKRVALYIRYQYLVKINTATVKKADKPHKLQVQINLPPDSPKEMKNLKIIYPQFWIAKK